MTPPVVLSAGIQKGYVTHVVWLLFFATPNPT